MRNTDSSALLHSRFPIAFEPKKTLFDSFFPPLASLPNQIRPHRPPISFSKLWKRLVPGLRRENKNEGRFRSRPLCLAGQRLGRHHPHHQGDGCRQVTRRLLLWCRHAARLRVCSGSIPATFRRWDLIRLLINTTNKYHVSPLRGPAK